MNGALGTESSIASTGRRSRSAGDFSGASSAASSRGLSATLNSSAPSSVAWAGSGLPGLI
jgi:hypothetical protein